MKSCNIYYRENNFYVVSFEYKEIGDDCNFENEIEPMIKVSIDDGTELLGSVVLKCLNAYKKVAEITSMKDSKKNLFNFLETESCNDFDRKASARCRDEIEENYRLFWVHYDEEDNYFSLTEDNEENSVDFNTYPSNEEVGEQLIELLKK